MGWLRRSGRAAPERAEGEAGSGRVEGTAPGLAALLGALREEPTHSVLDLGPAAESSLAVYSRFARRIRFGDLFAGGGSYDGWVDALAAVPFQPEQPYDLVFAWDTLDRLPPEARPRLVQRLAELTAPAARLHLLVRSSEGAESRPLRFALIDTGRMVHEPVGPPGHVRPPLLPAEVERAIVPFQVERAFTLKMGLREYVTVRP